jgi:iron complex outermembrane receptor protein
VAAALVLSCAGISHYSLGQEAAVPTLEEVEVTAQIRADAQQDVPVSLTVVSGERLFESGIVNLEELTPFVPNFSLNQTGISTAISIRGISSGINQGFEQSVGMYIDGLHHGRVQLSRAPLFDLTRVEVLRGPQTVLFGKNSIAGAVSQITVRPSFEPDGFFSAQYVPEFNTQDYRFAIGGPLNSQLAGRLSAMGRSSDGWIENTTDAEPEPQSDESVLRGSLLWQPSERLGVWFKGERAQWELSGRNIEVFDSVTHPDPTVVTQPGGALPAGTQVDHITALNGAQASLGRPLVDGELNTFRDSNGDSSENTADTLLLQIDYELERAGTLTFITGYLGYAYEDLCDCDYTQASVFNAVLEEDYHQLSQEIRFTSLRGNFVDYLGGVYFQSSSLDFRDSINITDDSLLASLSPAILGTATQRQFEQDTKLWSAFGQLTLNFSYRFRLNIGARYSQEKKKVGRIQSHVDSSGVDQGSASLPLNTIYNSFAIESYDRVSDERSESNFSPLLGVEWDVNDALMLYASAVRGFKSGGYDARSNAHPDPAVVTPGTSPELVGELEYEPERVDSFELGAKSILFQGRAEFNAALFRMNYRDLQTSQFDGTLGFNVTNAGRAYSQGFEGDFRWQLSHGFMLGGNLSYLDFEFTEFANAQCYFGQSYLEPGSVTDADNGLCDAQGKRKEYTPAWRGALGANWVRDIGAYLRFGAALDLMYTDAYLWNPNLDPRAEQPAYTRIDARLSLGSQDGSWQLALVGKNLSNETIINYGGNTPLAGTLTQGTGNSYSGFVQPPVSVGLQAIYRLFR